MSSTTGTVSPTGDKGDRLSNLCVDQKLTLTLNLFTKGFSFNEDLTQYAWSSVVGDEVRTALDFGRLTHPLSEILQKTVSPTYCSGGILVEVRDFRHVGVENFVLPLIGRVFLQPTQQSLLEDMNYEYPDSTLESEEAILKTVSPLCLDPSPDVFYSLNLAHYNDLKSVIPPKADTSAKRSVPCRKRIHPRPSMSVPPNKRPRIDVVRFLKKIGKPPDMDPISDSLFHKHQIQLALGLDNRIAPENRSFKQMKLPGVLQLPSVPPKRMFVPRVHTFPKHIQFQIDKGKDTVTLEVISKENGCYDGRLRFGSPTEPGEPSEIFSLGNMQTTQGFITSFREDIQRALMEIQPASKSLVGGPNPNAPNPMGGPSSGVPLTPSAPANHHPPHQGQPGQNVMLQNQGLLFKPDHGRVTTTVNPQLQAKMRQQMPHGQDETHSQSLQTQAQAQQQQQQQQYARLLRSGVIHGEHAGNLAVKQEDKKMEVENPDFFGSPIGAQPHLQHTQDKEAENPIQMPMTDEKHVEITPDSQSMEATQTAPPTVVPGGMGNVGMMMGWPYSIPGGMGAMTSANMLHLHNVGHIPGGLGPGLPQHLFTPYMNVGHMLTMQGRPGQMPGNPMGVPSTGTSGTMPPQVVHMPGGGQIQMSVGGHNLSNAAAAHLSGQMLGQTAGMTGVPGLTVSGMQGVGVPDGKTGVGEKKVMSPSGTEGDGMGPASPSGVNLMYNPMGEPRVTRSATKSVSQPGQTQAQQPMKQPVQPQPVQQRIQHITNLTAAVNEQFPDEGRGASDRGRPGRPRGGRARGAASAAEGKSTPAAAKRGRGRGRGKKDLQ